MAKKKKSEEKEITFRPEIAQLGERWRKNPSSLVFVPLAEAYRKSGMLEEALDVCEQGLEHHPENAGAHVVMAKCHIDSKKPVLARNEFEEAISLDPQNIVAIMGLAQIYREREMNELAAEHYQRVLELDPSNSEAERILAKLEVKTKPKSPPPLPPPLAVQKQKKKNEKVAFQTNTLADLYEKQGFYDKALNIYEGMAEEEGMSPELEAKINELRAKAGKAPLSDAAMPVAEDSSENLDLSGLESLAVDDLSTSEIETAESLDDLSGLEELSTEDLSNSVDLENLEDLEDVSDFSINEETFDDEVLTLDSDDLENLESVAFDDDSFDDEALEELEDISLDDAALEELGDLSFDESSLADLEEADLTLNEDLEEDEALELSEEVDFDDVAITDNDSELLSKTESPSNDDLDINDIFIDRRTEKTVEVEEATSMSQIVSEPESVLPEVDFAEISTPADELQFEESVEFAAEEVTESEGGSPEVDFAEISAPADELQFEESVEFAAEEATESENVLPEVDSAEISTPADELQFEESVEFAGEEVTESEGVLPEVDFAEVSAPTDELQFEESTDVGIEEKVVEPKIEVPEVVLDMVAPSEEEAQRVTAVSPEVAPPEILASRLVQRIQFTIPPKKLKNITAFQLLEALQNTFEEGLNLEEWLTATNNILEVDKAESVPSVPTVEPIMTVEPATDADDMPAFTDEEKTPEPPTIETENMLGFTNQEEVPESTSTDSDDDMLGFMDEKKASESPTTETSDGILDFLDAPVETATESVEEEASDFISDAFEEPATSSDDNAFDLMAETSETSSSMPIEEETFELDLASNESQPQSGNEIETNFFDNSFYEPATEATPQSQPSDFEEDMLTDFASVGAHVMPLPSDNPPQDDLDIGDTPAEQSATLPQKASPPPATEKKEKKPMYSDHGSFQDWLNNLQKK